MDTITDFVSNSDYLLFSKAVFTTVTAAASAGLGTAIATSEFIFGAGTIAATSATQHFIYNTSTGALYYDADGNTTNGVAAVQVALLGTHPALVYTDIHVIA